ncbi:hypothetical protein RhiXN_10597 [Rhizoctonia solani]|uniref:Uncharacterized protein n=1 Tax=Rhizoctonia solani TaxID=456999 RepID=A0A8H8P426_9AGAM|nr:uncharacterized protein RhiXN_10597 [Rhizoctonia solani]QRW24273.1 hypothetical protein RhiXN_10597 [Rhizoctonia solani]
MEARVQTDFVPSPACPDLRDAPSNPLGPTIFQRGKQQPNHAPPGPPDTVQTRRVAVASRQFTNKPIAIAIAVQAECGHHLMQDHPAITRTR